MIYNDEKIIAILVTVIMLVSILSVNIFAANATNNITAIVSQDIVKLRNKAVNYKGFKIADNNYYKLRDIAKSLSDTPSKFEVLWNEKENAIEIITGKEYTAVEESNSKYYAPNRNYKASDTRTRVLVDGKLQSIKAYNIDDSNYFKLRDLGQVVGFDVEWDGNKNEIKILPSIAKGAYRLKPTYKKDTYNYLTANFPRWKSQVSSYIVDNDDGTLSIVETNRPSNDNGAKDIVTIDTYDRQNNLINSKSIDFELPLFGGFYSGEKYNYLVFGQENKEENDNKEVIRIVKYDKNYNRIGNASIKGGESFTIKPFDYSSGRIDEHGDTLVLHTSRTRYTTEDGLNHQSQLTIVVDTSTMKAINDMGRFQYNHVSHSFDQYVLFDKDTPIYVDHGDAYPRSVVLTRGAIKERPNTRKAEIQTDLFEIPGKIGANATGISIGGFEISSKNYMVAMNTIDHSLVKEYTSYEMVGLEYDQRDIIVCISPRTDSGGKTVESITHGHYVGSDKNASVPHLVKISDNKFALMWQEFSKDNKRMNLKYVLIDENGKALGSIREAKDFVLSECKPIIIDNNIVWYTNEGGERILYKLPL